MKLNTSFFKSLHNALSTPVHELPNEPDQPRHDNPSLPVVQTFSKTHITRIRRALFHCRGKRVAVGRRLRQIARGPIMRTTNDIVTASAATTGKHVQPGDTGRMWRRVRFKRATLQRRRCGDVAAAKVQMLRAKQRRTRVGCRRGHGGGGQCLRFSSRRCRGRLYQLLLLLSLTALASGTDRGRRRWDSDDGRRGRGCACTQAERLVEEPFTVSVGSSCPAPLASKCRLLLRRRAFLRRGSGHGLRSSQTAGEPALR